MRRCKLIYKASIALLLLSLLQLSSLSAQSTFHIANGGNDNGPGTEVEPWATIQRVRTELQINSNGNQTFLFKRNDVFGGSIQVPVFSPNVNFGAYGVGDSPIITGSKAIVNSAWTPLGGGLYSTPLALAANFVVKEVFEQGQRSTLAREPNMGWNRTVTTDHANGILDDPALSQVAGYWAGAELVLRINNWSYGRYTVLSSAPGTLTANGSFTEQMLNSTGWGYFLCNKLELLDAPGEWYHDGVAGVLYYRSYSTVPQDIEYVSRSVSSDQIDRLVNNGISYNTSNGGAVIGLAFEHHAEAGVAMEASSNIVIADCEFRDVGAGIAGDGGTGGNSITNCLIERATAAGIRVSAPNMVIEYNTLKDICLLPGEGVNNWGYIALEAANSTVQYNTLDRVGYIGISLQGSGVIANNTVSDWLITLNDGAGITIDNCDGVTVRDNVVHPVREGFGGRSESVAPDYEFNVDISFGIYFGNQQTRNVTVENNVVSGCAAGIHVDHTTQSADNVIRNNVLFDNDVQLSIADNSNCTYVGTGVNPCLNISLGQGAPFWQASYNSIYEGNVMYCLKSGQRCMQQTNSYANSHEQLVDFGTFQNNYYFNPFSDVVVYQIVNYNIPNITDYLRESAIPHTLQSWQFPIPTASNPSPTARDLGSNRSPLRLKDFDAFGFTAIPNDGLSADMNGGDLSGWLAGTYTSPVCNDCVQGGHALRAVDQNWIERNGTVMWTNGQGTQGTPVIEPGQYHFTFRMRSPDTDAIRFGPVYQDPSYRQYQYLGLSPEWRTYEMTFNVPDLGGNDYMVSAFQNVQYSLGMLDGSVVELDFIEAKACTLNTGHSATIAQEHILRYNCPLTTTDDQNVGASFTIPGTPGQCWSDVYGNFYAAGDNYPLDPWESVVLFRMDATYDIDVAAYDVQGNETWTTDRNVRGSVVIADGGTLTIDGATIRFAESTTALPTNIIVEPGGMLVLKNNAHLTTVVECGAMQMWDGIKVLGITAGRDWSPEQGRVEMLSGARISNALTGILAGDADPAAPGFTGIMRGGAIRTQDAFFENNLYDVVMHQGGALPPLFGCNGGPCEASAFRNTQFLTTAPLNRSDLDPKTHVRLSNRRTTWVYGCTFSNELPEHTESLRMGHGVECFNTAARIVECLTSACGTPAPNTFSNLDHGVRLLESFPKAPVAIVRGNTFTDNICGVYASGVNGVSVVDNSFTMGRWSDVQFTGTEDGMMSPYHRGVFTTASNALEVMDNQFTRTAGNSTPLEGIVVGYTRDANEVVFRNTATGLDQAFVGEGVSADVDDDPAIVGLQFQCNENSNNETNFISRIANGDLVEPERHTIRERQGTTTFSASNTFDGAMHFEVDTRADAIEYITYSHASGQSPATYTQQDLGDLDKDYLVPALVTNSLDCISDPPVWLTGSGENVQDVKNTLSTAKLEYGNLRYQYEQLIDGGSTDEVVEEIVSAWPQEILDLRESLLQKSPYLSVEALKELMMKPGIPDALRAEVLIANPDATKKDGFLKWAELDAPYPLPGYLAQTVEASWQTRTYRTTLEEGLADKHTRLTQLAYHALNRMQSDSVQHAADSLLWVLRQVRTNGARYTEAAWLVGQERYREADSLVQAMPSEKNLKSPEEQERQRMSALVAVLASAAADGRDAYRLNGSEVDELKTLVEAQYDRPAVWASNLLCAVYSECRVPFTGPVDAPKSNRARQRVLEQSNEQFTQMMVQPNPAKDWASIAWSNDIGWSGTGELIVRDSGGSIVQRLSLNTMTKEHVLSLSGLAPGVYMLELFRDQHRIGAQRLVIQR